MTGKHENAGRVFSSLPHKVKQCKQYRCNVFEMDDEFCMTLQC